MNMKIRTQVRPADPDEIRALVTATGFFTEEEVGIAAELIQEAVDRGTDSGYLVLVAEHDGRVLGYTCYGPIPGTDSSYDLYWIAVHPDAQGHGLGKTLIRETEKFIQEAGGQRVYIETSSRDQYAPTRRFYLSCGYAEEARLLDFYRPGDSKVMYSKKL
ncbi:MAG: GNAT family N-acetyltransferase [Acidobacteria bacterium]|nr:MAG: GNAT family N-acetyltransferase [Acidobacteriota bacterium]